jgi:hypothetical protein
MNTVKEIILQEKRKGCSLCGYNKSLMAIHFHHLNPADKSFSLTEVTTKKKKKRKLEEVKLELHKCIRVCSNCHCEIHEKLND